MNPYDFVRFGRPGPREPAIMHDRFREHSGQFVCRLTALTHIFTPKTQEVPKHGHAELELLRGPDGLPLLPGSSLKGVIRSVAEAISGSCLTLPQPRRGRPVQYRGRPPVDYRMPADFEHCSGDVLCAACRLFGSLSGSDAFLGKVSIGDAVAVGKVLTDALTIEALMEPKPRHRAWYEHEEQRGTMRGRKFYRHRPLGPRTTSQRTQYNKTIEAARPGTVFDFTADYVNLTDDELALLIFSLVLEGAMRHKVGMGKPVGLGSAKIEVVRWQQLDRRVRYNTLGGGVSVFDGDALAAEVDRWRAQYHQQYERWKVSLAELRRIWCWDPAKAEDVRYPPRDWFRQNSSAPLKDAP
jgi:CRISPR/Cas system CSM-associated protein Csm3 (group 7 of RAMP superfamily)